MTDPGVPPGSVGPVPPAATDEYLNTKAGAFSSVRTMVIRHVAVALISAGGTTYLVRALGPAAWGGFAITYLLLFTADSLLSRGLIAGLLRDSEPADPMAVSSAARLSLYGGLIVSAVLLACGFALTPLYDPPHFSTLMVATAICALLYAGRALPGTLLERGLRYRPIAAGEIGDTVAFYGVAIPLVATGAGVKALAVATLARGAASFLIVRSALHPPMLGRPARQAARRLLPFGVPLAAMLVVGTIDGLVPVFVIGRHRTIVGFLVTATTILGYAIAVLTATARVAVPSLARLSRANFARAARRTMSVTTFLTCSVLLPIGGLASLWVVPLLGRQWTNSAFFVELVAAGMVLAGPIGVLTAALTAAGRTRAVFVCQVVAAVTYALVGAVMLVGFGPRDFVVAYVVSRGVFVCGLWLAGRSVPDLVIDRHAWTMLALAGGGLAALVFAAHAGLLVGLLVAAVVAAAWLSAGRNDAAIALRAVTVGLRAPWLQR